MFVGSLPAGRGIREIDRAIGGHGEVIHIAKGVRGNTRAQAGDTAIDQIDGIQAGQAGHGDTGLARPVQAIDRGVGDARDFLDRVFRPARQEAVDVAIRGSKVQAAIRRGQQAIGCPGFANAVAAGLVQVRIGGQCTGQRRRRGFIPVARLERRRPHHPEQGKHGKGAEAECQRAQGHENSRWGRISPANPDHPFRFSRGCRACRGSTARFRPVLNYNQVLCHSAGTSRPKAYSLPSVSTASSSGMSEKSARLITPPSSSLCRAGSAASGK